MLCHITDNLLKNQCETVFLGTLILVTHKNGSFFPISAAESTKIPKDKIGICSNNVIRKEVLAKSSHLSMVCSLSLKMRKMGKWRTKEDVARLKKLHLLLSVSESHVLKRDEGPERCLRSFS